MRAAALHLECQACQNYSIIQKYCMTDPFPRVGGRTGQPIALNSRFYRGGMPDEPFAIRQVKIYRSAVAEENLVAELPFVDPDDSSYPSPATRDLDGSGNVIPGAFTLIWDVPATGIPVPDIFFDVWEFIADDCTGGTTGATSPDPCLDDEDLLITLCNKFWLNPDGFFLDDGLEVIRFGFEALDLKLHQPEVRTIEVGLMPLPLYDFDFNLVAPLIPQITATFTLLSENEELLIDNEAMTIGVRMGSFRSNPFTTQFRFNTSLVESTGCPLLKGTYKYKVTLTLPNSETRVSPEFSLQIS